jgi:hypothetical protein
MNGSFDKLLALGIRTDGILLPGPELDHTRWAVVACDQYTSEPEYWIRADQLVGEAPSTLRLIFPEVWLDRESEDEKQTRIRAINSTMDAYLARNLLLAVEGPVLTERTTRDGQVRAGLMLSLDLERYDFSNGSQSLVRATEGTIVERLPPRIRIREHAALELPHIMILIDDPERLALEPLHAAALQASCRDEAGICKVYDFPLMENSGHLRGWAITDNQLLERFADALTNLSRPEGFKARYGTDDKAGVLLFAVGDGNHSLATAKSCWEKIKPTLSEAEREYHPARHALIELVNVHDAGLVFEPIHRVLFHTQREAFVSAFLAWHAEKGIEVAVVASSDPSPHAGSGTQVCTLLSEKREDCLYWKNPRQQLAVGSLQAFLDDFLVNHPDSVIDYVHGEDVTRRHACQPGTLGFLLPVMRKEELFPTVIRDGALPRKTFSMGEAHEKRFYLESRHIR